MACIYAFHFIFKDGLKLNKRASIKGHFKNSPFFSENDLILGPTENIATVSTSTH